MAETAKTKTVDIAPEIGITGDFKRITEYSFLAYNAKLIPVIVLCLMEKGSNQLLPEMGLKDTLMKMPFSTKSEVNSIINEMTSQMNTYSSVPVSVGIDNSATNWSEGDVTISIEVTGVPGTLSLGVNKKSVNESVPFNIKHPGIFA